MGLLELARVMLEFGMALLVCVGVVGETAGVVDAAEATAAKSGIAAAVEKPPSPKREPPPKAAEVESTTAESAAVEPAEATAVESAESATERRRAVDANREARGHRRACQQHASRFFRFDIRLTSTFSRLLLGGRHCLERDLFQSPRGSSGVNTGAAMRGAKSQSVNTAVNCGCDGCVL